MSFKDEAARLLKEDEEAESSSRSSLQSEAAKLMAEDDARVKELNSVWIPIKEVSKKLFAGSVDATLSTLGFADMIASNLSPVAGVKRVAERVTGESLSPDTEMMRIASEDAYDIDTHADDLVTEIGRQATFSATAGLGIAGLSRAGSLPRALQGIGEEAVKRPGLFHAGEQAIGAAAAGGLTLAKNVSDNPMAHLAGEVVGSLVGGGVLNVAKAFSGSAFPSLVERPSMDRAAEILQAQAADPSIAAKKLKTHKPTIAGEELTTAEITEDAGLLSREWALAGQADAVDSRGVPVGQEMQRRTRATREAVVDEARSAIGTDMPAAASTSFAERSVKAAQNWIDKRIDRARTKFNELVATLPKRDVNREALLATEGKRLLDEQVAVARAEEKAAWEAVDKNVKVDVADLDKWWQERVGQLSIAKKTMGSDRLRGVVDDVNAMMRGYMDKAKTDPVELSLGDDFAAGVDPGNTKVHISELLDIRSEILERMRKERSEKASSSALALMNDLQGEILRRLDETEAGGEALTLARDATRSLNDRFYRDNAISRFLGYNAKGGKKVDDRLILDQLFRPGAVGDVNMKALFNAVPTNEIRATVDDFVRRRFAQQVTNMDGSIDVDAARKFSESYAEALNHLPDAKKYIDNLAKGAAESNTAIKLGEKRIKGVVNNSRASLFLDAEPRAVVQRIMTSATPEKDMGDAVRLLSKDKSGAALAGFKTALVEHMEDKIVRASDDVMKSEEQFAKFVRSNNKALSKVLAPEEMTRLRQAQEVLRKTYLRQKAQRTTGSATAERLSYLERMAGRVLGAGVMRSTGMATIQATQAGANLGQRLVEKLSADQARVIMNDAIFDPKLMEALLMRPTRENTPIIFNRLRGHLMDNYGFDLNKSIEQDRKDQEQIQRQQVPLASNRASVVTSGLNFV